MHFHKNWQFITMKARCSQKIFSPSPYWNFENLQLPAEQTPTENPAREKGRRGHSKFSHKIDRLFNYGGYLKKG